MTIDENEMNRRLIKLAQSPSSRFWRIDYGALSPPERVFRVVWELEAEVNNGGFRQYFLNTSGSLVPPDTADALRAIGAATMSEIVEQAVEAVGHDISWSNDGARKAVLSALAPGTVAKLGEFDQAFFTYPDNLTALLYKYVSDHREEINVPSEF